MGVASLRTRFAVAGLVCVVLTAWAAGHPLAGPTVSDLPAELTHAEFWQLSTDLSERGGEFGSDNLVSNELSFAQVVPQLHAVVASGGVYLGVGPEQNFTYLAATRARMGFIVDIRRDNLLLHLMYKALFAMSRSRCMFVSRLFSRVPNCDSDQASTAADLMNRVDRADVLSDAAYQRNVQELDSVLVNGLELPLSDTELSSIRKMYGAFRTYGPAIEYSTTLSSRSVSEATYSNLLKQVDDHGHELSFLANDANYQFVRDLHARNLIVPVVGNFAGSKAIRRIAEYLKDRGATVAAFYVSNVEDYLGLERAPRNPEWRAFCANVAELPLSPASVFVRPLMRARFQPDGSAAFSHSVEAAATDSDWIALGVSPAFPSALSFMAVEVAPCRAIPQVR